MDATNLQNKDLVSNGGNKTSVENVENWTIKQYSFEVRKMGENS